MKQSKEMIVFFFYLIKQFFNVKKCMQLAQTNQAMNNDASLANTLLVLKSPKIFRFGFILSNENA